MKTKVLTAKEVKEASKIIQSGGLVAFPTETVYGLGADALNPKAVKKIFIAKGRPSDNPLIVHIAKKKDLFPLAKIPKTKKKLVEKLITKFWPGPLTIILKKRKNISKLVTANLDTIAIRMPQNKIAQNLIKYSRTPIAAPSANLSGTPSGTRFEHVFDDFNGKIEAIIKSRPCLIGLESTVIDLTPSIPLLLRPGGVSYEDLKKTIPKIKIAKQTQNKKPKSPGMKYKHYCPKAKIILFEKSGIQKIEAYEKKLKKEKKIFKTIWTENEKYFHKNMFKIFREADKKGIEYILISSAEEKEIGLAVMNRLRKSASKKIR